MVVPLLWLGCATKLACIIALTYRSPGWWVPGAGVLAVGGAAAIHGSTRTLGLGAAVIGINAIAIARILNRRAGVSD